MDALKVSRERYDYIAAKIGSEQSVVGIDAKETHIYIINLLLDLQAQLTRLEARVAALEKP